MELLDRETVYSILSHIHDAKDIYNFGRTNKVNNSIIDNPVLWKQKLIQWKCNDGLELLRNGIAMTTSDIFFFHKWTKLSSRRVPLFPPIQLQTVQNMEQYKILTKMLELIIEEGFKWLKRYSPRFTIYKKNHNLLFRSPEYVHSYTVNAVNVYVCCGCSSMIYLFGLLYLDVLCEKFIWWKLSYSKSADTPLEIAINKMKLELMELGSLPLIKNILL